MSEDSRIYLGGFLFRMDRLFGEFIEVGNPDNTIPFNKLTSEKLHLSAVIDPVTRNLQEDNNTNSSGIKIIIQPGIVIEGYQEGSGYAEAYNQMFSQENNVRLIDKQALQELENQPFQHNTRTLPEITLSGEVFTVDVAYGELRQKEDPGIRININDLEVKHGKYIVYVDPEGKRLSPFSSDAFQRYEIDQMVNLDPEGISLKYGLAINDLPENDDNLVCDPDLLSGRIKNGYLPIIKILDEYFCVDLRMNQLRSANKFWKSIDLNTLIRGDAGQFYFIYNSLEREIIHIPDSITEYPKNAVMVELPSELIMDPVTIGRKEFGNDLAFIKDYPLQHKLEARIYPISKSYIPELIHENRKKNGLPALRVDHLESGKKDKRNSRGKGL